MCGNDGKLFRGNGARLRKRLAALALAVLLAAITPAAVLAADHFLVYDSIVRGFGGLMTIPPGHTAIFVPKQGLSLYSRNWTSLPPSRWNRYDIVRRELDAGGNITQYWVIDAVGNVTALYPSQLRHAVTRQISYDCDHQSIKCPFNYRVR
ncbi:MAG: hypothetical protein LBB86_03615 [Oscillospiraceae bacterium]|jgi:hypothetical protein|nr:hypothetical protein [Oscillospiraceae bacterium]